MNDPDAIRGAFLDRDETLTIVRAVAQKRLVRGGDMPRVPLAPAPGLITLPRVHTLKPEIGIAGQHEAGRMKRADNPELVDHARDKGGVWFAHRIDIARWWLEHHQEFRRSD